MTCDLYQGQSIYGQGQGQKIPNFGGSMNGIPCCWRAEAEGYSVGKPQ